MAFRYKIVIFAIIWLAVASYFFKGIENAKGDTKALVTNLIGFLATLGGGAYVYMILVG
ncbi:MAG: hypothetical protein KBS56_04315 [Clostridiales bacterium]|nr:hypothetical protein [Candidatus Crickella equi]